MVKIDGTNGIDTAQIRAPDGDPVAMTVGNDGKVAFPAGNAGILGVGQTWQDVKASRAINTTYTNNTGRPIFVACSCTATVVADGVADFVIDGITVMRGGVSNAGGSAVPRANFSAVIPDGSTYRMNSIAGTMAVEYWGELR
jgi:hypothetical protein